jgi:lipid-A-disaccharide synthase-like uncharacterized protein
VNTIAIYALGFAGQAFFGIRLLMQWWYSEKRARVLSPAIFWYFSLFGSITFLLYGLFRSDPVIIIGQILSYYIYIRNLQLKQKWQTYPLLVRFAVASLPAAVLLMAFLTFNFEYPLSAFTSPTMIVGAVGQLALNLRFVYQWYYSEKVQESSFPYGFWQISVWASVLVIFYALFHPVLGFDPVLLLSQSLGIIVYVRNMVIARKTLLQNSTRE